MNCLECENFTVKIEGCEAIEFCSIRGKLFAPYLERPIPCCSGNCMILESSFFMQLEEVAKNCEHFRRRG